MDKESFMKSIREGSQHVLIAERCEGGVGLMYTRSPAEWLGSLAAHMDLGQVEVRPGAHAAQVVTELRTRFAAAHVPSEAMAWYLIDFKQAVDALDEYDIETGEPTMPIAINSQVMVFPNRQRGQVFGFTNRGRSIAVKLAGETLMVIVPRANVKPIYRLVAAS
jgi:hypothetical protein